jgi:hypothetical protein
MMTHPLTPFYYVKEGGTKTKPQKKWRDFLLGKRRGRHLPRGIASMRNKDTTRRIEPNQRKYEVPTTRQPSHQGKLSRAEN